MSDERPPLLDVVVASTPRRDSTEDIGAVEAALMGFGTGEYGSDGIAILRSKGWNLGDVMANVVPGLQWEDLADEDAEEPDWSKIPTKG